MINYPSKLEEDAAKKLWKQIVGDSDSDFNNWDSTRLMFNAAIRIERLTKELEELKNKMGRS